jgi:hypothetical protein
MIYLIGIITALILLAINIIIDVRIEKKNVHSDKATILYKHPTHGYTRDIIVSLLVCLLSWFGVIVFAIPLINHFRTKKQS